MIKAINISKSYGSKLILDKVNLEIKKGEATVVMGPNGSGKTTCLRNLSLIDTPDSGVISVNGKEYEFPTSQKFKEIYPKMTVVYQQLFLWPHLTNRENITIAVQDKEHQKQLHELIDFLDMSAFIDNYPNQSSLGQKQRVAIARALILNPEYVFFDEITSSLDSQQIQAIVKILNQLKKKNIGIFFITHHKMVAEKIADTIIEF